LYLRRRKKVLDVIDDIVISSSEKQDKEMAEAHVP
jgi:hypothetical protein